MIKKRGISTELRWGLAGASLGVFWFLRNMSLHPAYRGRVFVTDSYGYLDAASHLTGFLKIFDYQALVTGAADRSLGYPAYLAFCRWLFGWASSPMMDWVDFSLYIALAIHFLSAWLLYRTVAMAGFKPHPIALALLMFSPGLTSHAALPLADTLTAAFVSIGLSCITRSLLLDRLSYAALGGVALGAALLHRPSVQGGVLALIFGWMGVIAYVMVRPGKKKNRLAILAPFATFAAFLATLSPQLISCTSHFGTFCIQRPGYKTMQMAGTLTIALKGARTYTVLGSDAQPIGTYDAPDGMISGRFASTCRFAEATVGRDLINCYWTNAPLMPIYFFKKLIGLFDNFHLNTYATQITLGWEAALNRIYGCLAFLGFCLVIVAVVRQFIWIRPDAWRWIVPLFFPLGYVATSVIPHVESRYGFPVVPIGVVSFVIGIEIILKRRNKNAAVVAGVLSLLATVFFVQTWIWDLTDPIVWEGDKKR